MDFFYGDQSEFFSFYRIPKLLITDKRFKSLSCEAKLLYGLLIDRMSLSKKMNGWISRGGFISTIRLKTSWRTWAAVTKRQASCWQTWSATSCFIGSDRDCANQTDCIRFLFSKSRKSENQISGDLIFRCQEIRNSDANKTDRN